MKFDMLLEYTNIEPLKMVIILILFHLLKNDKKHQLEGKLQDIRCRLTTQRQEIDSTNKSRELRIAEITHLQQQLQVRKHIP